MCGCLKPLWNVIRPGNRNVIDFGQIMILGGEPENWDRINPAGGSFIREFDGSQGFVDRKHWPAEQPHLLSRQHGASAGAEASDIFQRAAGRTPIFVLTRQNVRHALTAMRIVLNARNLVGKPVRKGGWAAVKLANARRICKKIT